MNERDHSCPRCDTPEKRAELHRRLDKSPLASLVDIANTFPNTKVIRGRDLLDDLALVEEERCGREWNAHVVENHEFIRGKREGSHTAYDSRYVPPNKPRKGVRNAKQIQDEHLPGWTWLPGWPLVDENGYSQPRLICVHCEHPCSGFDPQGVARHPNCSGIA